MSNTDKHNLSINGILKLFPTEINKNITNINIDKELRNKKTSKLFKINLKRLKRKYEKFNKFKEKTDEFLFFNRNDEQNISQVKKEYINSFNTCLFTLNNLNYINNCIYNELNVINKEIDFNVNNEYFKQDLILEYYKDEINLNNIPDNMDFGEFINKFLQEKGINIENIEEYLNSLENNIKENPK